MSLNKTPYAPQDTEEVVRVLNALESSRKAKRRGSFHVKKTSFDVKSSRDGIQVVSWRLQDWDYKRPGLPTYARGFFTALTRGGMPEIVVRGYDKFFNVGEVDDTNWDRILALTQPPYELTLKENGCIIFISGLEDDTLLVCSKNSTGERDDVDVSHASAGEACLEKQLAALGKSRTDLARELRRRNVTAVAEFCDDTFEEHVLAYGPERAGLYLHGINLNLPSFSTYPSTAVQNFAKCWGFHTIEHITMNNLSMVRAFLEEAAQTGTYKGQNVEGFVIRCRKSPKPGLQAFQDWFFKYKFEEPYLMYRQWRECTKALIDKKQPKFKKHVKITNEYLAYARKRLDADRDLGKLYKHNHGIIALRNDFLELKNLDGSEAASLEVAQPAAMTAVTRNIILSPIATIGCGKTTLALALTHLFNWGHVQNDSILGRGRPPRFIQAVTDELQSKPVVFADRNNAQRRERTQFISDMRAKNLSAKLICLYFPHDEESLNVIRRVTQRRVMSRGDNHQTIRAATNREKSMNVMNGFIDRFEPCDVSSPPDIGFDFVINLDATAGSRANLEIVVTQLHQLFPDLLKVFPSPDNLDAAIEQAFSYKSPLIRDISVRTNERKDISYRADKRRDQQWRSR